MQSNMDECTLSRWLSLIHRFLEHFSWLADAFVLDFYTADHWKSLPASWQCFLPTLTPNMLADLLDLQLNDLKWSTTPPLGLLALKSSVRVLSLNRTFSKKEFERLCGPQSDNLNNIPDRLLWRDFRNLFSRHVKPKKRHEIEQLMQLISSLSRRTGSSHVYDVGSGLGHLARYLSYGCGLPLTCVDREESFGSAATKFDKELESYVRKHPTASLPSAPSHICASLDIDTESEHLQHDDYKFGLTGLHSCGNLSPVILHNFVRSPAVFVVSLGCCYMKLDRRGFPLSTCVKNLGTRLSYEALEVACHALEQYSDRLRQGQVNKLKTHSYRATLETLLVRKGIRRAGLRGVPHTDRLTFPEYAKRATTCISDVVTLTDSELTTPEVNTRLTNWFNVVLFYSLRLLVANVVETAVLLDRALFVKERDPTTSVHVLPVFNPSISPRNIAVVSYKEREPIDNVAV